MTRMDPKRTLLECLTLKMWGAVLSSDLIGHSSTDSGMVRPRPSRAEVHEELKCRGLLDWSLGWIGSLEDAIGVVGGPRDNGNAIGAIAHQAALFHVEPLLVYRGKSGFQGHPRDFGRALSASRFQFPRRCGLALRRDALADFQCELRGEFRWRPSAIGLQCTMRKIVEMFARLRRWMMGLFGKEKPVMSSTEAWRAMAERIIEGQADIRRLQPVLKARRARKTRKSGRSRSWRGPSATWNQR
jgi:hypothetical protein